jgi:hypothetical protein
VEHRRVNPRVVDLRIGLQCVERLEQDAARLVELAEMTEGDTEVREREVLIHRVVNDRLAHSRHEEERRLLE